MGKRNYKPSWKPVTILWTVTITILASILLFETALIQRKSLDAVDRINQVVVAARALVHLATNIESNLRGYLATGSPIFLEAYRQGTGAVDERFSLLSK